MIVPFFITLTVVFTSLQYFYDSAKINRMITTIERLIKTIQIHQNTLNELVQAAAIEDYQAKSLTQDINDKLRILTENLILKLFPTDSFESSSEQIWPYVTTGGIERDWLMHNFHLGIDNELLRRWFPEDYDTDDNEITWTDETRPQRRNR